MRVAVNSTFWGLEGTGSGQYLHNLLPHLLNLDPSTSYVLLHPRGRDVRAVAPDPWEARALPTPFDRRSENMAKLWFEQVAFPRACRAVGADVAHVPYFAPPLVPSVPTVVTIHDLIPLILPAYRRGALVRAYTWLVSWAARRDHLVLTDSAASARDIERLLHIRRERVRVVYLAADRAYHPKTAEECASVRRRLGLPETYLLYLGGFDLRKNVPQLLEAYALAGDRLHGLPLVIAGRLPKRDTPFAPDPRHIIARLGLEGRVHLPGWVAEADKPALYSSAVAFCFPSTYEGFGLPVLEAISCGTPAIVASGSSLEEVAGPGALVVPPGDVRALAEALIRVTTDARLRDTLSSAGLEHSARFSWQRTAAQTLAAYEQALQLAA